MSSQGIKVYNKDVVDRVMAKALINYLPDDGEPEQVKLFQDSK